MAFGPRLYKKSVGKKQTQNTGHFSVVFQKDERDEQRNTSRHT